MPKDSRRNPFYIDTTTGAELFSTTPKTVIDWEKAAGKEKKSFKVSHGIYDIRKFLSWWLENIYSPKIENSNVVDARERYWHAKADIEEMDVAKRRGELLERSELLPEWVEVYAEFRQACLAMESKLASVLEMKTADFIRVKIRSYSRGMLDELSRKGESRPEPKAAKKKK